MSIILLPSLIHILTVKQCDFHTLPDYLTSHISTLDHINVVTVTPQANPSTTPVHVVVEAPFNLRHGQPGFMLSVIGRVGDLPAPTANDLRPLQAYVWGVGTQTFRTHLVGSGDVYVDNKVSFT